MSLYFIICSFNSTASFYQEFMHGKKLVYQETQIPDYFQALRPEDLEELVDEEHIFADEYKIRNLTARNMEKAEQIVSQNHYMKPDSTSRFITGEPYY